MTTNPSTVTRFTFDGDCVEQDPDGHLVRYEDYEILRAENERLEEHNGFLQVIREAQKHTIGKLHPENLEMKQRIAQLEEALAQIKKWDTLKVLENFTSALGEKRGLTIS
jgi:hypothetical protein